MEDTERPFLLLMRHGATEWNLQDRLNSRTDISVRSDERTRIQAVGRRLRTRGVVQLLSSPSRRSVETAELLVESLSLEVVEVPLLREVDFGAFEGKTQAELADGQLKELYAAWQDGEENVLGAESLGEAAVRAASLVHRISESPSPILAVSHGVFIRVLLATQVLNMKATDYRRLRVDNGRLCAIARQGRLFRLIALNSRA